METSQLTNATVKTQYIDVNGIRFAYRTFGKPSPVPLVFLQHFTGTMDNWDPLVTNGLAKSQQVILFNNRGVASSEGQTPDNVAQMASDTIDFITALKYQRVNLLGYSLGGFIGQLIAVNKLDLVHKLILVGTGPQGGEGIGDFRKFLAESFKREGAERYLFMFFEQSASSRSAGRALLSRLQERTQDRDATGSDQTLTAQTKAIEDWGLTQDSSYTLLKKIVQPAMVVNGSNDAMFPTINSYQLFQALTNAQLNLYPDSAHGSLFQYPDLFVEQASFFLR